MLHLMRGTYTPKSKDQLKSIAITPRGTRSSIWKGIQHFDFVDCIHNVLRDQFKITPVNEGYLVSPNGAVLLGGFELIGPDKKPLRAPEGIDVCYSLGFRHGNDSSRAVECAVGGRVGICDNGMFTGDERWKHKHTTGLKLWDFVRAGLQNLLDRLKDAGKRALALKDVWCSEVIHNDGLLHLGRMGIIPWRLLEHVDANWRVSGEEVKDPFHDRNLWSWYNIVTDVAKRLPANDQFNALNRAFLLSEYLANSDELPPTLHNRGARDRRNYVEFI